MQFKISYFAPALLTLLLSAPVLADEFEVTMDVIDSAADFQGNEMILEDIDEEPDMMGDAHDESENHSATDQLDDHDHDFDRDDREDFAIDDDDDREFDRDDHDFADDMDDDDVREEQEHADHDDMDDIEDGEIDDMDSTLEETEDLVTEDLTNDMEAVNDAAVD